MKKTLNPAIFFGSGPVAAASLSLLIKHVQIEAVITKPSTYGEMSIIAPNLNIHTVNNRQELDNLFDKYKFNSKYGIIIDFGIIVSQQVIDYFEQGIINSHFSLLPQWRGADPISFAVLSGQEKTGVSLMILNSKLDEGAIIAQGECEIDHQETTPSLTNKLILLSDALLKDVLPKYLAGIVKPVSQIQAAKALNRSAKASYSRKLTKDDGILNPTKTAEELEREVRAFIGWPSSRIQTKHITLTILNAIASEFAVKPGTLNVNDKKLFYGCRDGSLEILELKPAGKKNMSASAFINGYAHILEP